MSLHSFKIHAPLNSNGAFVEMDGKRLEGVTRIEFALAAQETVEVRLTVWGYVDITGEFSETELVRAGRPSATPDLLAAAKEVMAALEKHGGSIVPHLMDTDMNAGQRLRNAIAASEPAS